MRKKPQMNPAHLLTSPRRSLIDRLMAMRGAFNMAAELAEQQSEVKSAIAIMREWADEHLIDNRVKLTPARLARVQELDAMGWRAHTIAKMLGLSEPTVRRIIGAKTKEAEAGQPDTMGS